MYTSPTIWEIYATVATLSRPSVPGIDCFKMDESEMKSVHDHVVPLAEADV